MARPQPIIIPGPTGMGGSYKTTTGPDLLGLLQGLTQLANLYQSTIGAQNANEVNQAGIAEMARMLGLNKAEAGQSGPAVQSPTGGVVNQPSMPSIQPVNFNALANSPTAAKAIQNLFEKKNTPPEYSFGNDAAFNKTNPQDQYPVGVPRSATTSPTNDLKGYAEYAYGGDAGKAQLSMLTPEGKAAFDAFKKTKDSTALAAEKFRQLDSKLQADPASISPDEKRWHDAYISEKGIGATAYGTARSQAMLDQPTVVWDTATNTKHSVTKRQSLDNPDRYQAPTTPAAVEAMPTTDIKVMQQSAPSVISLADKTLANMDDNNLGPLKSRWRDFWEGKVGTSDPQFAALRADVNLMTTRLMKMHVGSRGSEYMMKHFAEIINMGKESPDNMRSAINEIRNYAVEVNNHRVSDNTPSPKSNSNDLSTLSNDELLRRLNGK